MTSKKSAFIALALVALVSVTGVAGAETVSSARRRQTEARARRAQIAARLQTARASDRQLEAAVRTLDSHILGQQAQTDAARQAAAAAQRALAAAEARLGRTRRQRDALRSAVKARAVAAYMNPSGGTLSHVLASADLTEATRKRELLDEIMSGDTSLLDKLRATEDDLAFEQARLAEANALVSARRRRAEARLAALRYARSQQNRLRNALNERIREFLAEADQVAAQESTLVAFIRSHDVSRASRDDGGAGGRVSGAGLIWPVSGPVTSEYGSRWGRMHEGIDIGAGSGTPIRAARAGTVTFSGQMSGYGNVIIVDHGGGFSTLYAHQSRLAARAGQDVGQGEVIGYVGSTGHSTGPHLHFETRVNGNPRNPRNYLP